MAIRQREVFADGVLVGTEDYTVRDDEPVVADAFADCRLFFQTYRDNPANVTQVMARDALFGLMVLLMRNRHREVDPLPGPGL